MNRGPFHGTESWELGSMGKHLGLVAFVHVDSAALQV